MDPSQMETRKSPITRSKSASIVRNQAASEEPNSDDVFVTPRPPRMLRKVCVRRPKPPVQAQQVKKKTYPTVRCAPGSIVSILSMMSRSMKEELIRLGFKDFLGFALDKIDDRALVVFIMDHIEVDPLHIVVNGRVLPITPLAVKHVLGLPDGTRSLDDLSASEKANYLKQLRAECERRGMKNIVTEKHNANPKLKAFDDLKPNEIPRCCLLKASQDLYYRTSHSCIEQRSTIVGSFLDASICKSSFIDFFGTCVMLDDQSANPIYPSYRIILPIQLSNTILYEQYHTGSPYSHTVALSILSDLFDPDQLLLAKLVIVPVYHSRDLTRGQGHWSLYCVNLVHGQIDILDPFRWTSDQHRDCYHGAISGRIRYRLNALFHDFTNGRFIDFSQFGLPFVQVPKFAYSYDDALYIMLFMEHYDAVARKVDAVIILEFGTQYKAQILYYMMFHKLNEKKKELPYDISVLAPC